MTFLVIFCKIYKIYKIADICRNKVQNVKAMLNADYKYLYDWRLHGLQILNWLEIR